MAEANPQASNLSDIPNDVIINTVAQVEQMEKNSGDLQTMRGQSIAKGSVSTSNVTATALDSVLLKTLEDISDKFALFQQQAQEDKVKVAKLYEQLENQNSNVSRKNKTPVRKVNQKKGVGCDSIVNNVANSNQIVTSLFSDNVGNTNVNKESDVQNTTNTRISDSAIGSHGGARPRTAVQGVTTDRSHTIPHPQQMMTYEQFLNFQQVQSNNRATTEGRNVTFP